MGGPRIAETGHAPDDGESVTAGRWVVPALICATFASSVGSLVFGPLLPLMARDLGVGVALLGQIPAIAALLAAALSLAVGPLADRYGHVRTLGLAQLGLAVGALATGLAPTYALLLAAILLATPGRAAVSPAALAIVGARFAGETRRRAIGWITAGISGAAIVGVPLLTAIAAAGGWRVAFGALAALSLGSAALARLVLGAGERRPPARLHTRDFLAVYRPLVRHQLTRTLLGSTVLGRAGTAALTTYLGAFYAERHGFTPQQIGGLYFALGLGLLVGSVGAEGPLGRVPLVPMLIGARLLTGALVTGALLAPLPALVAGALLTLGMVSIAASTVAATTLLASEAPGGRATAMALNGTAIYLGTALGGAGGGLLLALGGYVALGLGTLGLYGAASTLLWRARPRQPGLGIVPRPVTGGN